MTFVPRLSKELFIKSEMGEDDVIFTCDIL